MTCIQKSLGNSFNIQTVYNHQTSAKFLIDFSLKLINCVKNKNNKN